jgi:hypothetical protein
LGKFIKVAAVDNRFFATAGGNISGIPQALENASQFVK